MKIVEIFSLFMWILIGLLLLMPIVKLIRHSCFSKVKNRRIQILLIGSFLLSIYLGHATVAHGAFAPPFSHSLVSTSLHSFSPVISTDFQTNSLLAQTSNATPEGWGEVVEEVQKWVITEDGLKKQVVVTVAIVLLVLLFISRRLFGYLLKVVMIFFFLILLVQAIFIFTRELLLDASLSSRSPLLDYLSDVWRVFGLVALLGVLALLLHWLSSKGGIVVLPFEVVSKELFNDQGKTEDRENRGKTEGRKGRDKENYYGKAIADLLIEELYRIQHIHALPQELVNESTNNINIRLVNRNFPPLSPNQNQLGDVLTDVGTVEVGKTQLSLGRLLLSLRRIWPFGGPEGIVTGSFQTYGQLTRIVVHIEYRNRVRAWEVTRKSISLESIPQEMIRELAYKIVFEILPREKRPAETWEAFRDITEAISCFIKYFRTKPDMKIDELRTCDQYLKKAREDDYKLIKQEGRKSEILADFFYKVGFAYLLQGKYREAEKNMKRALETDSNRENYHYYYNGLGNIYWKLGKPEAAKFEYERSIHHVNTLKNHRINLGSLSNDTIWGCLCNRIKTFIYKVFYLIENCLAYLSLIQKVSEPIKQKVLIFPYPYNGLGNLNFENGNFEEAKTHYLNAIKKDREFWTPYHNLGVIYSYRHEFFDDVQNYSSAIKQLNKAINLSRYEDFGSAKSNSSLGLAYFFKAIALQSDFLIIHQKTLSHLDKYASTDVDIDIDIDVDIEALSVLSIDVGDLLEKALHHVQLAVDIDGENSSMYWNLGLVKLGQSTLDLDEVQYIWGEAAQKARQEEEELCCSIYNFVRLLVLQCEHFLLQSCMEEVKRCLDKQYKQKTVKQGTIKIMLKDLSVIKITLLKHCIETIASINDYDKNLENQRILQAFQYITTLQKELRLMVKSTM